MVIAKKMDIPEMHSNSIRPSLACGPGNHQRGLALITVMLVLAIAVTTVSFMTFNQSLWVHQTQNMLDRSEADSLIYSLLLVAIDKLGDDLIQNASDNYNEGWHKWDDSQIVLDRGTPSVKIYDAQARFNLNNLHRAGADSLGDISIMQNILLDASLDPQLVNAMLDWIDVDNNLRPNGGAEDTDYLYVPAPHLPYRAANQPFVSAQELRLIRGFDDVDSVNTLTGKNKEFENGLVTALPALLAPTPINVNTANEKVLRALFPSLSVSNLKTFIDGVPYPDKATVGTKLTALGLTSPPPATTYDVKTSYFVVTISINFDKYERITEALIYRPPAPARPQILQISHPLPEKIPSPTPTPS